MALRKKFLKQKYLLIGGGRNIFPHVQTASTSMSNLVKVKTIIFSLTKGSIRQKPA